MKPIKAWHFTGDTLRDGRKLPIDGKKLIHGGTLEMCRSGLHASKQILDALKYAPGSTICRVELSGKVKHDPDKMVASERVILWRIDGEDLLRRFARRCALDVIHLWDAPKVVLEYLKTGDEELRGDAGAAARDSAWDAGAAGAAAWAARNAARAAWDSARAAAWGAAGDKQKRRLSAMVAAEHRRTTQ